MIGPSLSPRQRRRRAAQGPIADTPPAVTPMTAQEGVQVARTQGSYSARGGGSVSITTSEWRVDGAQVGTGATYTPDAGDVGGLLAYFEEATETGGTAPGSTIRQVTVGAVQAAAGGDDNLQMDGDPLEWNGDQLIFNAA
jgi:hypothetical protein